MKNNSQILTEKQRIFLEKISQNDFFRKTFYLTGGTALATFYLQHRYSEDLDFFSDEEIDILSLDIFLKSMRYQDGEILKTEFTYYPFARIEKGVTMHGVEIDSLLDIAVNKLFTIYQRSQIKDYIDLYFICGEKKLSVADLIKRARTKFDWHIDPIQLGAQFVKIKDLKDLPKMSKEVKLEEIEKFFIEEAKKLKDEIIET